MTEVEVMEDVDQVAELEEVVGTVGSAENDEFEARTQGNPTHTRRAGRR